MVSRILSQGFATPTRKVPSAVLIALTNDEMWSGAQDLADQLRARGIACEVSATAAKFGKQIKYAEKRGIPFVWFISTNEDGSLKHEVKDIRTGEQGEASPENWMPPAEDLQVRIVPADSH